MSQRAVSCQSSLKPSRILGATNQAGNNVPSLVRQRALDALVHDGLPYSKKLLAHTACVNTLACSKNGRWLASAGDDPYIYLWDFDQEDLSSPTWGFHGPTSNVFTLAFSASGQYVYSGDTEDIIYRYDLSHLGEPVVTARGGPDSFCWRNVQHDGSIRAISCHPNHDHLFLSAAEDGRVILHDMREARRYSRAQSVLQHTAELTCVEYHPIMTDIFATSDSRGQVCLRDVRMAFGPASQRQDQGVVHQYVTTVSRQGNERMARPEASSLTFDREGQRLGVTMLHHFPALYALNDPYPIATFSGRNNPDGTPLPPGETTYSNSCTMKHGGFGGLGLGSDQYYAQGSDDFRTYIWKIPSNTELLQDRKEVDFFEWGTCCRPGETGYASSLTGTRYVPTDISTPFARLTGHESIVNTAIFHPQRPLLLTAGIERFVRLHSPTSATSCTAPLDLTPTDVRTPLSGPTNHLLRALGLTIDDTDDEDDEDDRQAIALFDQILRQEGNGDVFDIHPWEVDSDSSDEDMETDSDSNDSIPGVLYQ